MWLHQIKEFLFHRLYSLVLTVTSLCSGRPTNRDSIPGVQTGSEAHQASFLSNGLRKISPPPRLRRLGREPIHALSPLGVALVQFYISGNNDNIADDDPSEMDDKWQ
jgi:hypothetical protein